MIDATVLATKINFASLASKKKSKYVARNFSSINKLESNQFFFVKFEIQNWVIWSQMKCILSNWKIKVLEFIAMKNKSLVFL